MQRRSFDLGAASSRARRIRSGGGVIGAACLSFGTALLTVAVSVFYVSTQTALLSGFAIFLLALPFALLGVHGLQQSLDGALRRRVRENLVDHDLLLITLQDDAGERLPALRRWQAPGLAAGTDAGSFQERLNQLAGRYHHVCRDAGLEPFPATFGRARWVAFVSAMVCLMLNGILTIGFLNQGIGELARPFIVGTGMLLVGVFFVLHTMVGAVATEELIKALEDWWE